MRKTALLLSSVLASLVAGGAETNVSSAPIRQPLPPPSHNGPVSVEEAIAARRSVRAFDSVSFTPGQIGQLCWAAQGITDKEHGLRAAPSAGALYPIELYVVSAAGVDHYLPTEHALERVHPGDFRDALRKAAGGQASITEASVTFVIAAVPERTAKKYGERAERYCLLEAGHVAQNILLQATSLRLGGVPIGAYDETRILESLKLPKELRVLYLVSVGRPR